MSNEDKPKCSDNNIPERAAIPKVCILSWGFRPLKGGLEDYVTNLSNLLCEFVDLTVLTKPCAISENKNYKLCSVYTHLKFKSSIIDTLNPIRLNSVISKIKPDILHIQLPFYHAAMRVAVLQKYWKRRFPDMKIVLTIHEYTDERKEIQQREDLNIQNSDHLIVVDPIYIDDICKNNPGIDKNQVSFIQNSQTILSNIDNTMVKKIKEKYSRNGKYLLMGFFGLIGRVKTLDKILEAMKNLKLNNSLKTRFLILGKIVNQEYYDYLKELTSKFDLADYVDFVGYLEPNVLNATISALDFMNMPFSDGYSPKNSSMITVLSQNKPVITTLRQGHKTLETNGIYYLNSYSDVEKMEEYILMFQNNPSLLTDVDYSMVDFSWERNVKEHLSLYQKLLSK